MMEVAYETPREQELEFELQNIRAAFEEYIKSSRELEGGLDQELTDMRKLSLWIGS
jgi:hypothetical protein